MAHFPRGHAGAAGTAAILAILWSLRVEAQAPAPAYPSSPYPAAPYPSQPGYPAQAAPPLQSGGLTPPPSSSAARPGETETYQQLERAEREDAGRGLEFVWLAAEAGYEYVSLDALQGSSLLDGRALSASGSALLLGAGVGVRVIFLTVGARVRVARQSAWDLWTLNGEVGLHLPMGELEPSFSLSAGYATLGSLAASSSAPAGFAAGRIDIGGFNTRLGAALDWYLNPLLSLGVHGSAELLVLSRSRAAQPELAATAPALAEAYAGKGSAVGLGAGLTAVVGLHF